MKTSLKSFVRDMTNTPWPLDSTLKTLQKIVKTKDKEALEQFCLGRTYNQVTNCAKLAEIDLEELEELLTQI